MKKNLLLSILVIFVSFIVSCKKEEAIVTPAQAEHQETLAQNEFSQYFTIEQSMGITELVDERDGPVGRCCDAVFVKFYTAGHNTIMAAFTTAIPYNARLNIKVERLSDGVVWNSGLGGSLMPTTCLYPSSLSVNLSDIVYNFLNNCEADYRVTCTLYKPEPFGIGYTPCSSATSTWWYMDTDVFCMTP